MHFYIVSPTYNAEKWIKNCIDSVKAQTINSYTHIIIDDASTDNTKKIIKENKDKRVLLIEREKRYGVPENQIKALEVIIENNLGENDLRNRIVVHLDGDDWFCRSDVLGILKRVYSDPNIWMTYGSYKSTDPNFPMVATNKINTDIRENIVKGWPFSHLRTFRAFLYPKIKKEDLRKKDGTPFMGAADVVLITPMLELSGLKRVVFINEPLMWYNRHNEISEDKVHLSDQVEAAMEIYRKPKYQTLP